MYRLVITDVAISDIIQGKSWYNDKQKNLGDRFADAIFKSISDIKRNPNAYPNKYKYTREKYVRKFPYVIIYSIEEGVIFILRIFACKQNPAKKYKREDESPSLLNEPLIPYGRK
jgi:plasmid stabilization system protein ParE